MVLQYNSINHFQIENDYLYSHAFFTYIGYWPICFIQVGLFSALLSPAKGGDSIELLEKPLMAAVTTYNLISIIITHAVPGVSPRAACQGGKLSGKEK